MYDIKRLLPLLSFAHANVQCEYECDVFTNIMNQSN